MIVVGFARTLLLTIFLLIFPHDAAAGLIQIWQFKETAKAPVLVAGRILAVHKYEQAIKGSLPWNVETWWMTADVERLRSYSNSGEPLVIDRLQVRYLTYGPSVTMFINGTPPPLPQLEPGDVVILPLLENRHPVSEAFQLTAKSGVGLTIPARPDLAKDAGPGPTTARAFLIRELANMLSRGTAKEVFSLSTYLSLQMEDLSGELLPLTEPTVGDNRERWAEIVTNVLAAQGIPRPGVADLLSGKTEGMRASLFLAQAALRKLKASPETDELLIRTWITEAPWHAWGSANSLIEYANHPITTETLQNALRDDVAGSSYVALVLAHSGNKAILPQALARALRVVDRPHIHSSESTDFQGAASLLRDYGSDRDLAQLAALVRKYQTLDPKVYGQLWQYATGEGNPREARVLAVVLSDRRIVFEDTRYCDLALGILEKASGEHFGGGRSIPERDAAILKGMAWIKAQGLVN